MSEAGRVPIFDRNSAEVGWTGKGIPSRDKIGQRRPKGVVSFAGIIRGQPGFP
jgi:hypothetical protein